MAGYRYRISCNFLNILQNIFDKNTVLLLTFPKLRHQILVSVKKKKNVNKFVFTSLGKILTQILNISDLFDSRISGHDITDIRPYTGHKKPDHPTSRISSASLHIININILHITLKCFMKKNPKVNIHLPDNSWLVDNLLDEAAVLADDLPDEIPGHLVGSLRVFQHQPRLSHSLLCLTNNLGGSGNINS